VSEPEPPALEALRARQDEEDEAYAAVLSALDRIARDAGPPGGDPVAPAALGELEARHALPAAAARGGVLGPVRRAALEAAAPALAQQSSFNATLVRLLAAHLERSRQLEAGLAGLAAALVRYAQRVQPLVDARDRVGTALATTRSELVLEAFDRRLESLGRRLDRLAAREELRGLEPLLQVRGTEADVGLVERQEEGALGALVVGEAGGGQAAALFRAAHRALRPGGRVAVLGAQPGTLAEALEAAGFRDVRVEEASGTRGAAILARR
jgi:hypothetical protein